MEFVIDYTRKVENKVHDIACKFQLMLYINIIKSPVIIKLLYLVLEELHSCTLDVDEILDMDSDYDDFGWSTQCALRTYNYNLECSYIKYIKGYGKENNSWFKSCRCRMCGLIRLLYKVILYRDFSKSCCLIANVLIKLRLDFKFTQLFELLIVFLRYNLNAVELICPYPRRMVGHIVLILKVDSFFRRAKRQMIEACSWIPMNLSAVYRDYGVKRPMLIAAGRLGLLISVNRFNFLGNQHFSAYAKWWVKQKIIQVIIKESGGLETIRNASNKDGKMVKLKRLSLDYCLDESGICEDIGGDDEMIEEDNGQEEEIELPDARDSMISAKLALMSPSEERAVRLKAMSGGKMSLSDIGMDLGLSKEHIRQLLLNVKEKLTSIDTTNIMRYSRKIPIDLPLEDPDE
ncbi:RNA polymerase sigma factor rpoD [Candidatus Hodgkinia cicadicola]|uniref:RNA polymerase sigma factor rpoD n=1 Tax=Candidatus Hodgkinia cicadicola TaxID=573658 RepID=A0ABX4MHL5_9HYPH|nr:RNA polymerase sigma factor rpoD [Candidatus Hodgkinia cicadicola]